MNPPRKHHYLPEFYIKGFTNDSGKLAIFDCKKKQIKKGEYAPATHFYIKNRNTIKTENDVEKDFLENFYAKFDNRHAPLLKFIKECNHCPVLSQEQWILLQEFVVVTFWRLPANDEYYWNEFSKDPIFTKTFKILKKDTGLEVDNERTRKIKSSEAFVKSIRAMAHATTILAAANSSDFDNWRITYTPKGFNLCSDNPIIVKDTSIKNILETDFIIPLTKNHKLIRTLKTVPIKSAPPELTAKMDVLLLNQSISYCGSPRRDYIEAINSLTIKLNQHKERRQMEVLKNQIFDFLENPPKDCQ
jgi:Protein of unknown function (DUF4238)